jgi:hypothetical protein
MIKLPFEIDVFAHGEHEKPFSTTVALALAIVVIGLLTVATILTTPHGAAKRPVTVAGIAGQYSLPNLTPEKKPNPTTTTEPATTTMTTETTIKPTTTTRRNVTTTTNGCNRP